MTDIVERLEYIGSMCGDEGIARSAYDGAAEITRLHQLLSEAEKAKTGWAFAEGDPVRKKSGSWWEGRVVGTYSTEQTPRGYAVQLDKPFGPVQIYPESALESALQSEERG